MPALQVTEYVRQRIGIDPNRFNRASDCSALIQAAQRLNNDLSCVLYNAVVQLGGNTALYGAALTPQQFATLSRTASNAKNLTTCPENIRPIIQDFEGAAKRYANFLGRSDDGALNVSNVINKQLKLALEEGTRAPPRHTLLRRGGEIYEVLTWMTADEAARLEDRFPNTKGLFSIQTERSRTKEWCDQYFEEHKITLGSGAFGAARVARHVGTDQYMVLKKVHPKDLGPKPAVTPVIRGLNDGSSPGVSRVYDSFMANSTRDGGEMHAEPSAYTLCELGVIDTQQLFAAFSMMAYALNPNNFSHVLAQTMRGQMVQSNSRLEHARNTARVGANPCSNPENVRKFRNTLAFQMLQAVQQMHSKGHAHNDIKPDNFILAYDSNNLLRVKLIDFDLSASVKESVGRARDVYAEAFAAPQVSSTGVNNQADRNDAYSMGCTLRVLNGEPLETLVVQRMMMRGEIRDSRNRTIKPVEDRREIESRFAQLPELTTLSDLVDLLCHPHSGKRYTISEALGSPLFTQSGNLQSNIQFSQMAETIIQESQLIPANLMTQLGALQQCEQALTQQSGGVSANALGSMAATLSQQDRNLLLDRYKQTHGERKLNAQMAKVQTQVTKENGLAVLRRGMRQLSVSHHMKSAAEREAGYVYKTPKK